MNLKRIKSFAPFLTSDAEMQVQDIITEDITNAQKIINDKIEEYCRAAATPPIKGEITAGKLKWRGIYIVQLGVIDGGGCYIVQRGKQISPILKVINENPPRIFIE